MKVILIAFTNIEYTIELAESLSELVDLTLMMPDKHAFRFEKVIDKNVSLKVFKQPRLRQIRNLKFIYKFYKNINNINPDIIHIQRGHPWFNFILPFLNKYRIVTTIHDVIQHTGDKESSKIPAFTHRLAINHADQIIVHGNKLKHEMLQTTKKNAEDINVLHRGINSIYTRYKQIKKKGNDLNILFFGRIFEYKGLKYLIDAEPLITKIIPKYKIVIAGRGEDFKKIYGNRIVNEKKFVVYNQHISNEMVAELFYEASVVALPYIDASQSGVVPLAYAFQKPVVVTRVGSLPEVVKNGETGVIVEPKNTEQLAAALIKLLSNDELRKRMGKNAELMAREELSWDNIAEKTLAVYKKAKL